MTTLIIRDRSHLKLVVNNVVAANGGLRSVSRSASPSSVAAEERSFSPVRLVRTVESTAFADALVDAYHSQRQVTPFRSVLRIKVCSLEDSRLKQIAQSAVDCALSACHLARRIAVVKDHPPTLADANWS
jgi:hypothetical protein